MKLSKYLCVISIFIFNACGVVYISDQAGNDYAPIGHHPLLKSSIMVNVPDISSLVVLSDSVQPSATAYLSLLDLRIEPAEWLALDLALTHQFLLVKIFENDGLMLSTGFEHSQFLENVYQIPFGVTYRIGSNYYVWANVKNGFFDTSNSSVSGSTIGGDLGFGYILPEGFFVIVYLGGIFPIPCDGCIEHDKEVKSLPVAGFQLGWSFSLGGTKEKE